MSLRILVLRDLQPTQLPDHLVVLPSSNVLHLLIPVLFSVLSDDPSLLSSSRRRPGRLDLESTLVAEMEEADEAVGGRDVGHLVGRVGLLEGGDDGGEDSRRFRRSVGWRGGHWLRSKNEGGKEEKGEEKRRVSEQYVSSGFSSR